MQDQSWAVFIPEKNSSSQGNILVTCLVSMDAALNLLGVERKQLTHRKYETTSNISHFKPWRGEIILVLAIVLILFGAKKLPELAKGLDQGTKELRKATHNCSEDVFVNETSDDDPRVLKAYGGSFQYNPRHWSFLTGPAGRSSGSPNCLM